MVSRANLPAAPLPPPGRALDGLLDAVLARATALASADEATAEA
jgi:hypothetical protein